MCLITTRSNVEDRNRATRTVQCYILLILTFTFATSINLASNNRNVNCSQTFYMFLLKDE